MAKGLLAGWAPGGALDTGRFNFRQPSGIGLQVAKRRDEEQRVVERDLKSLEADWRRWVRAMFPGHVSDDDGDFVPFGKQHERFWEHLWSIRPGVRPDPSLYGWPRGQAKSTSMEMGTVALGARGIRPYGLYLCNLQDQANEHVTNVRDMISNSDGIARYYPELSARAVGKYGHSEGWNRTRLSTASGFTVDAIGLDTASGRGKKFKIHRPGFIIIDDIDDQADSPAAVLKKILALKNRILPAGSSDVAVIGGQNMVHPGSIFSLLFGVGDAAPGSGAVAPVELDFLADRVTDGPIKAVEGLEYERLPAGHPEGFEDRPRYLITAGEATWEGMDLDACQRIIDTEGISAFLEERQHEVNAPPGGMYDHIEFDHCGWGEVPWAALERIVVWVDPAVTNNDGSDSHAIQADGLASTGLIYRLYSWESRTSPEDSLRRAILKAVELGAEKVGVETDQGGDTWRSVFREAKAALVDEGDIAQEQADRVRFDSDKAGAGHGSKVHRNSQMLADYERGRFVHVTGTHNTLERALKRFPRTKPLDLADACLVADTPVLTDQGEVSIQHVKAGGRVLTRAGYRTVRAAGKTREDAEIVEAVFADGRTLRGTANHPVWTVEQGWKPLGELRGLTVIMNLCPAQSIPSKWSTTDEPSSDILVLRSALIASITSLWDRVGAMWTRCTGRSGATPTAGPRSRMSAKSIIWTVIRSTTLRITSPALPSRNIGSSTETPASVLPRRGASISLAYVRRRPSGTAPKRAGRGIVSMGGIRGLAESLSSILAGCAASLSTVATPITPCTAPSGAATPPSSTTRAIWSNAPASVAARPSSPPSTESADSVRSRAVTAISVRSVGRASVYNLSVEDQEEYFANGVLVHNCYWSWHDLEIGHTEPATSEADSPFGEFGEGFGRF